MIKKTIMKLLCTVMTAVMFIEGTVVQAAADTVEITEEAEASETEEADNKAVINIIAVSNRYDSTGDYLYLNLYGKNLKPEQYEYVFTRGQETEKGIFVESAVNSDYMNEGIIVKLKKETGNVLRYVESNNGEEADSIEVSITAKADSDSELLVDVQNKYIGISDSLYYQDTDSINDALYMGIPQMYRTDENEVPVFKMFSYGGRLIKECEAPFDSDGFAVVDLSDFEGVSPKYNAELHYANHVWYPSVEDLNKKEFALELKLNDEVYDKNSRTITAPEDNENKIADIVADCYIEDYTSGTAYYLDITDSAGNSFEKIQLNAEKCEDTSTAAYTHVKLSAKADLSDLEGLTYWYFGGDTEVYKIWYYVVVQDSKTYIDEYSQYVYYWDENEENEDIFCIEPQIFYCAETYQNFEIALSVSGNQLADDIICNQQYYEDEDYFRYEIAGLTEDIHELTVQLSYAGDNLYSMHEPEKKIANSDIEPVTINIDDGRETDGDDEFWFAGRCDDKGIYELCLKNAHYPVVFSLRPINELNPVLNYSIEQSEVRTENDVDSFNLKEIYEQLSNKEGRYYFSVTDAEENKIKLSELCRVVLHDESEDHEHKTGMKHEAVSGNCVDKGTIEWYECIDEECSCWLDKDGNELASIEGTINPENHKGTAATWIRTATTHKEIYDCCGAVKSAETEHIYGTAGAQRYTCTVCAYENTDTIMIKECVSGKGNKKGITLAYINPNNTSPLNGVVTVNANIKVTMPDSKWTPTGYVLSRVTPENLASVQWTDIEKDKKAVKEFRKLASVKYNKKQNQTLINVKQNRKAEGGVYAIRLSDENGNIIYINIECIELNNSIKKKPMKVMELNEVPAVVSMLNAAESDSVRTVGFTMAGSDTKSQLNSNAVWTAGSGKNAVTLEKGVVTIYKDKKGRAAAYLTVADDGSVRILSGAVKGSVKLTGTVNMKNYKTTVKIK